MLMATKVYADIKIMGSTGYSFIWYISAPSGRTFCFLSLNMVPADAAIPKQSRKMVKLRILSNAFIQKTTSTQTVAKAVREVNKTPFDAVRLENIFGNTPSSAMAYITRGLLISKTFTYANTDKKSNT